MCVTRRAASGADCGAHLAGITVSIQSPDELVAALPNLLGFKPEESIALVPISGDLPTIRVDLPTTPRDPEATWAPSARCSACTPDPV